MIPSIEKRSTQIKELREATQEALCKAQKQMIQTTKHHQLKTGDRVWLEGTNLKLPYQSMKLAPRRYGPFRVAAMIGNTSYQLDLPETWKIHPVFHGSLLTPYKETEMHGPNFLELPPEITEEEPEWEVETILQE